MIVGLVVVGMLACSSEDPEVAKGKALSVAHQWVEDSTELVAGAMVEFVVGEQPAAAVVRNVVAEKIHDQLDWTYSEADRLSDGVYGVTATAKSSVALSIPLVGSISFEATLPIDLEINVDDESVTKWTPVLRDASVRETS